MESSDDNGATWVPMAAVVGGPATLKELTGSGTERLDLVAEYGPECVVGGLTSFTGGEYWERNDSVLDSATYVLSGDASAVVSNGMDYSAPCGSAIDVATLPGSTLVLCPGEAIMSVGETGTWAHALKGEVLAISADYVRMEFVAVVHAGTECGQLGVISIGDSGVAQTIACLDSMAIGQSVTISSNGSEMLVWGESGLFRSEDSGLTWAQVN
jgi:photosystem II stability/assembly factor-like uncharacterized protein